MSPPAPSARRGRQVSPSEFRRLWFDPSLSQTQIGEMLGISYQAVRFRAIARGLPSARTVKPWVRSVTPQQEAEFRRMWLAGVRSEDIRQHFGMRYSSDPARSARLMGLPKRGRAWRATCTIEGFLAGRSDVGRDEAEVRRLWEAGLCYADIGAIVGGTKRAVAQYCAARGWHRGYGWRPRLTLAEWREGQLAERMAEVAARESAALRSGRRRAA